MKCIGSGNTKQQRKKMPLLNAEELCAYVQNLCDTAQKKKCVKSQSVHTVSMFSAAKAVQQYLFNLYLFFHRRCPRHCCRTCFVASCKFKTKQRTNAYRVEMRDFQAFLFNLVCIGTRVTYLYIFYCRCTHSILSLK